jgi:hypothetical protein
MSWYSVDNFRDDLEKLLTPHSISIGKIERLDEAMTVETTRTNGTEVSRVFTLNVTQLWPATATRLAEVIREFYETDLPTN